MEPVVSKESIVIRSSEDDIGRLQVPMGQTPVVEVREASSHIYGHLQPLAE